MTSKKKIKISDPPAIEFDRESSSSEELSDDGSGDSEEENAKEVSKILAHINITDHLSTLELPDVLADWPEDPFKNTELVIKFSPHVRLAALLWFIERVTAPKSKGGAELLLLREPYYGKPNEGLTVHVTAATWRQLEVAEMLDIKKVDLSMEEPSPVNFKLNDIMKFMRADEAPEDILTAAEKQIVVMHELKHLHSRPGEKHVPGYEKFKLITGASIFNVFVNKGLITTYFALHDEKHLNKLAGRWFREFFEDPPYEDIRAYFGDQTCLWFNFIAYYTFSLTLPAAIGLITVFFYLITSEDIVKIIIIPFAFFNMFFVTLFIVMWQRHQSKITYMWGTIKMNFWEEPRANYHGILALDPVTGSLQRRYPYYKTFMKTYVVSLSLVFICCVLALWVMYIFQDYDIEAKRYAKPKEMIATQTWDIIWWKFIFPQLPVIGYSIFVFLSTLLYRYYANGLTEWENHRTESQFERHLVSKMVVFEVVNNFGVLYYTAFIQGDNALLQQRLFSLVVIVQVLGVVDQCIRPIVFRAGAAKMHQFLQEQKIFTSLGIQQSFDSLKKPIPYPGLENEKISVMEVDDPRVQISKVEGTMDPYNYEVDFDEYLFLFLQFGFTFLFSAVYPVAACYAFLINIFFLMTSLFKMREVFRRVMAKRVSSIGAWKPAFEALGVLSVVTNCALVYKSKELRMSFPQFTDTQWFTLFVCIEHGILVMQYFVKKLIPKIPHKVKVGLAAQEFKSNQALKREQATNTRRRVTRYFAPINEKLLQKNKAKSKSQSQPASRPIRSGSGSAPRNNGSDSDANEPGTSSEMRKRKT